MILFFAARQFLEGMGIATPATVVTLFGLATNIAANRVLIYGIPAWGVPAMGVVGSGWATTIVRWVMLAAIGLHLVRRAELHPFRGVSWRLHAALLGRIARIGAPVGAQIGLYTGEADIVALGTRLLFMAALFQVFDGGQVAGMSVLRGAADTTVPMIIAAVGYWIIGLPIGYALAFGGGMGAVGVWAGLSAGLAAVALALVWRVRRMLARLAGAARRDARAAHAAG